MAESVNQYEMKLLAEIKRGSEGAFSILFDIYYRDLVLYCSNHVRGKSLCEDIVQNIFYKLWNDRRELVIDTSLKSYLIRAVRNSCIDEFRHNAIIRNHVSAVLASPKAEMYETENYVLYSDLREKLDAALEEVPEKFREAFRMNRFENMKYREIAVKLDVSERTVEVRIGKALEVLRDRLKEFMTVLFILINM